MLLLSLCVYLTKMIEAKSAIVPNLQSDSKITDILKVTTNNKIVHPAKVASYEKISQAVKTVDAKVAPIKEAEAKKAAKKKKKTKTVVTIKNVKLPAAVKVMKPEIKKAMKKYKLSKKYEKWILAMVTQESHGQGSDPFQVSEAECGSIGCISDRSTSIDKGIKVFKRRLKLTKKVLGYENTEITLQTYNYGTNYLYWLKKQNATQYNPKDSVKYAKKMCGQGGTSPATAVNDNSEACYGDYLYVKRIKQYIDIDIKKIPV